MPQTGISVEADGPYWLTGGGRYGVCNDYSVVPAGPTGAGVLIADNMADSTSYVAPGAPPNLGYSDTDCNVSPPGGTRLGIGVFGPNTDINGKRVGVCNDGSVIPYGPSNAGARVDPNNPGNSDVYLYMYPLPSPSLP